VLSSSIKVDMDCLLQKVGDSWNLIKGKKELKGFVLVGSWFGFAKLEDQQERSICIKEAPEIFETEILELETTILACHSQIMGKMKTRTPGVRQPGQWNLTRKKKGK